MVGGHQFLKCEVSELGVILRTVWLRCINHFPYYCSALSSLRSIVSTDGVLTRLAMDEMYQERNMQESAEAERKSVEKVVLLVPAQQLGLHPANSEIAHIHWSFNPHRVPRALAINCVFRRYTEIFTVIESAKSRIVGHPEQSPLFCLVSSSTSSFSADLGGQLPSCCDSTNHHVLVSRDGSHVSRDDRIRTGCSK